MNQLGYGSRGPQVQFLQLALNRSGSGPVATDGIFGFLTARALQRFQQTHGIPADGRVGSRTCWALRPYLTGYLSYTAARGDSLYTIARKHHTSLRALEAANPRTRCGRLSVGDLLTVPLSFPVVPTGIPWTSQILAMVVEGLCARYPFLRSRTVGRSVMGKPLYALTLGHGPRKVLYNATHHANEWITTPLLLKFAEELCAASVRESTIDGVSAAKLLQTARFLLVPCVNPDGMDLVTGQLREGGFYQRARQISADYPHIPFPDGWKANLHGVDLNLQYPAAWEQARTVKFTQGTCTPAPRDYVGTAPLTQPEARTMVRLTELSAPDRILAFHTQGQVIFPHFMDFDPPGSMALAWHLAAASGYTVMDTPTDSAAAGYKDWFIQTYNRPGYTIEAGRGTSPLPLEQFETVYEDNLPIMVLTALLDT